MALTARMSYSFAVLLTVRNLQSQGRTAYVSYACAIAMEALYISRVFDFDRIRQDVVEV